MSDAIRFLEGDLFSALAEDLQNYFDLIISNPPYIPRDQISKLDAEVSRWEPRAALDGGVDGLDFYRRIAEQAPGYLRQRGAVAVEIGAAMGAVVSALFRNRAAYGNTQVHQDYSGRDRVVLARAGRGRALV